jgi:hypothetical protein
MMNVFLAARLRRQWPVAATLVVLALFLLADFLFYGPLLKRYDRALTRAGNLGAVLDPSRGTMPAALPPRVYALLMENSGAPGEVDGKAQAGTLAAELVQQLSSLATQQHLDVVVAEPGAVLQQPGWNEARAHLRMRGAWGEYLSLLDALARSGRLYAIERFVLTPSAPGHCDIELWVAGTTLKRRRPGS